MRLSGRSKRFESVCQRALSIEKALRASLAHQGAGSYQGQRKMHSVSGGSRRRDRNSDHRTSYNQTSSAPLGEDVAPASVNASVDITRPPPSGRGSVMENSYPIFSQGEPIRLA